MIVNIALNAGNNAMITDRTVTLPEGEVKVKFISSYYALGVIVGTATRSDGKKIKFKTSGDAVDITELCDRAGEIKIAAALVCRNEAVKHWSAEPIILKEIDNVYEPIPEVSEMRTELNRMREELNLTKNALLEIKALLTEQNI